MYFKKGAISMICAYCGAGLVQEVDELYLDEFVFKITNYYKECDNCAISRINEAYSMLGQCINKRGNKILVDWEEYWLLEAEAQVISQEMHAYFKAYAVIFFESIGIINNKKGFRIHCLYVDQIAKGYFFRRKTDVKEYIKRQIVKKAESPSIIIRFAKPRKIHIS